MKDIILTTTVYEGEKQIYKSSANLMCYLQTIQSWIPCSERLPEKKPGDTEYLVTINNIVTTSFWSCYQGRWTWNDDNVIAWMPVPEPYKGEEA